MKEVYVLIIEPRSSYEDFEGSDYEILGVFKNKEDAVNRRNEDMKEWNKYAGITEDNYLIERYEVKE